MRHLLSSDTVLAHRLCSMQSAAIHASTSRRGCLRSLIAAITTRQKRMQAVVLLGLCWVQVCDQPYWLGLR